MTDTTLLILGASGDLTNRLLLPGLGSLFKREPDRPVRVVGADRVAMTGEEFADRVGAALAAGGAGPEVVERQKASSAYFQLDVTNGDDIERMIDTIGDCGRIIMYFALPPAVTEASCRAMLNFPVPEHVHLAMEKPFGHDQASAAELNAVLAGLVPEVRVHRVDHFLGKSSVLDLLAIRFANRLFFNVWSAEHIESVEIFYDEDLALEQRAAYYDKAGAFVDMIQSHLMQVLSFVAMEAPAEVTGLELRDKTAAVLRAVRLWGDDPAASSRRARYTAGNVGGVDIPDYVSEEGVEPARMTETLAQVTVVVRNQRWSGVPFTLRSGKALGQRRKEIVVTFRDVRHLPDGLTGPDPKDSLVIGLSPDTMELHLTTNAASDPLMLEQSVLRTGLRKSELDAYGEVLAAILDGDILLSVRGDTAEEAWRVTDEVLAGWRRGEVPMDEYAAGAPVPASWDTTPWS
jgi:glucose-6-phosphate 1-dehydrogenase